jgi:PTH1 family peptidyl-tRNA hydrolase
VAKSRSEYSIRGAGPDAKGDSSVKIIVGLGNPGREYAATRHNLGFMVVDELARRLFASDKRFRFRAEVIEAFDEGEKLVLVKPQTYMNLSGVAVREAIRWYKAPVEDVIVVADDIDLPFGTLRMRATGSSGGHNGLKSIFAELGTQNVPRLKIGVGRGAGHATRQVLTRFSPDETRLLPEIVAAAAECVLDWERHGIVEAMNRCNRRHEPATASDIERDCTVPVRPQTEMTNHTGPIPRSPLSVATGAYNRTVEWWTRQRNHAGDERVDQRT